MTGGTLPGIETNGASVQNQYAQRAVTIFPIHESELKSVSLFNALALAFFSIGSFLLSSAISLAVSGAVQAPPTDISQFMMNRLAPGVGGLAVAFYIIGIALIRSRGSILSLIKKEMR